MKYLVIVESPAKAKIIEKYLKSINPEHHYIVKASFGHVRDLGKNTLSIDIENNYNVLYENVATKEKLIKELNMAARQADVIYLGTDNDREGESIAWHLKQILPKSKRYFRITFNEITKDALQQAIENPRDVDQQLCDAQQSRRVIDRLVGYKISPLLWKTFNTKNQIKLSAGRVQSATLNIICDREAEIDNHKPQPYWNVSGSFTVGSTLVEDCKLYDRDKMSKYNTKTDVHSFLDRLTHGFTIMSTRKETHKEKPDKPFITSTLQQEAYNKIGLPTKLTMKIAQELYEGGHITYMRTDSFCLSQDALKQIETHVKHAFGHDYIERRANKTGKHAHEAIRPTNFSATNIDKLGPKHAKLYKLIFDRTIASQMKDAIYEHNIVYIQNEGLSTDQYFKGIYKRLVYPGWRVVYGDQVDKSIVSFQGSVRCKQVVGHNVWPSAPARYNEASLVKLLEHEGIGRPSTYSSIIEKLYDKQYIIKQDMQGDKYDTEDFIWKNNQSIKVEKGTVTINNEKSRLVPTDVGKQINAYMMDNFTYLVDASFTNEMETKLDMVADGKLTFYRVVDDFWKVLEPLIRVKANEKLKKTSLETAKHIVLVDDKEYTVRLAKYGPVIQYDDKYVGLKAYLSLIRRSYTEINEQDVKFLTSMPLRLTNVQGASLCYGRYGLYVKLKDDTSVGLTPCFIKKNFTSVFDVVDISSSALDTLIHKKQQAVAKNHASLEGTK